MTNELLKAGQYVVAGIDTFADLVGKFIRDQKQSYVTDSSFCNFLNHSINKYLYSYGSGLSYKTKRMSKNHTQNAIKMIKRINGYEFMKKTELYIDSGGFQVSMGAIKTEEMPRFIEEYYKFVFEHKDDFSWAFGLDLPPGPGSGEIFESYQQIENLNRMSYQLSSQLPEEAKKKVIYIHHFRTPSLYKTWTKFLFDEDLGKGYNYYGTGGIVANLASDLTIPVIIYTIPLSSILRYVKSKNITKFKFHILGGANYSDVFYHKLFAYHIKKVHNIDIDITYDSSAIFKGLLIGRYIPVLKEDNTLVKMDLRSKGMHLQFDGVTIEDKTYSLLNELARDFNFKEIDRNIDPIYDLQTNTFSKPVNMYLMAHILYTYRKLELASEKIVQDVYPLYEAGEIQSFDEACINFTRKLNQGKNSRKQKAKTYSLYKSLKILTDLDESFNEYLVDKFMMSSDISVMDGHGTIKF